MTFFDTPSIRTASQNVEHILNRILYVSPRTRSSDSPVFPCSLILIEFPPFSLQTLLSTPHHHQQPSRAPSCRNHPIHKRTYPNHLQIATLYMLLCYYFSGHRSVRPLIIREYHVCPAHSSPQPHTPHELRYPVAFLGFADVSPFL